MNGATPRPRATRRERTSRQRGISLVLVLWLIVLLGAMAAGHARNAHTDTLLASRQVQLLKARALAEAGVSHLILDLLSRNRRSAIPIDGTVFGARVLDQPVTLAVRDATGLVDLNAAGAELLSSALRAAGADDAQTLEVVEAILDWRDPDRVARLHGAEAEAYAAAGLGWTPRNAGFAAVEELKHVLGMTQTLYDRVAPLVTVHSGRGGLNLEYAPPALIESLVGGEIRPIDPDAGSGGNTASRGIRRGIYHIYASAAGSAGTVAAIEVVVAISGAGSNPFTVLEWRDPPRAPFPPSGGPR